MLRKRIRRSSSSCWAFKVVRGWSCSLGGVGVLLARSWDLAGALLLTTSPSAKLSYGRLLGARVRRFLTLAYGALVASAMLDICGGCLVKMSSLN